MALTIAYKKIKELIQGDGKKAATACGVVEVHTPDEIEDEQD